MPRPTVAQIDEAVPFGPGQEPSRALTNALLKDMLAAGVQPYTWAAKPAANAPGAGTQICVTDVGTPYSFWYTDGINWRPVNGSVVLRQIGGSMAAPIASFTGSGLGPLIIPGGNVKIPAGLLLPGAVVSIETMERARVPSNSGSVYRRFWLGTSGNANDSLVHTGAYGPDLFNFTSDFRLAVTSSTVITSSGGAGRNAAAYNAYSDFSKNVNTAADMYVSANVETDPANTYQLISLVVKVQQ